MRDLAEDIWRAGVAAVDPTRCVSKSVHVTGDEIGVSGQEFRIGPGGRCVVLGAGKAAASMAAGVLDALRPATDAGRFRVEGLVSVPSDCVRDLGPIEATAGRPAGRNEPTAAAVAATDRMLRLAATTTADDVVLLLISGGGSALLAKPAGGLSLEDKLDVTRRLAKAGASIGDLNTVRRELSAVKGGRFADAIATPQAAAVVISDIVGDPLDLIASGPGFRSIGDAAGALSVLRKYGVEPPSAVRGHLLQASKSPPAAKRRPALPHAVVASNAVAVRAAAAKAEELGFRVESLGSENEGEAAAEGRNIAERAVAIRRGVGLGDRPVCLLSGGEPTVRLAKTDLPQKGGRNQELAVAAAEFLRAHDPSRITLLAGGTDGEDGPTDAAGGFADAAMLAKMTECGLDPREFLAINNTYPLLERADALFRTGPTGTNVMDLRVVLIAP